MSEEVTDLIETFLSLCLEQRQLKSSSPSGENVLREEELKVSGLELAIKLYTKAAELERAGDISKGILCMCNDHYSNNQSIFILYI